MEDKFWELATKYLANEALGDDIDQLFDLLKSNKIYQKKFDELAYQWNVTGKISHSYFDANIAKSKISFSISSNRKKARISKKLVLNIAAVLILFVGISGVIKFLIFPSDKWVEYATNSNQHLRVILPDSSIVWLNNSSTMSYNFSDKSTRQVRLEGEGFFEIKRDTTKPFTVQTNYLLTKVLGTSFNINSQKDEVSVISGIVKVASKSEQVVLLKKGEQINYNKLTNSLQKIKIDNIHNKIAWKDEVFDFDNITIEEALSFLAETYNVTFKYSNDNIRKCIIKASFKKQSLKTILSIICTSIDCTYQISKNENKIIISGKGC